MTRPLGKCASEVCRSHKSAESLQLDIFKTYHRHARDTLKGFIGQDYPQPPRVLSSKVKILMDYVFFIILDCSESVENVCQCLFGSGQGHS